MIHFLPSLPGHVVLMLLWPICFWDFFTTTRMSSGIFLLPINLYKLSISFEKDVVSIRLGQRIGRDDVAKYTSPDKLHQWQFICIEEPFTLTNTAHSVYDERAYLAIKRTFLEGYTRLHTSKNLNFFLEISGDQIDTQNII